MQDTPTKILVEFFVLIFCYLFNFFNYLKLKFFNGIYCILFWKV